MSIVVEKLNLRPEACDFDRIIDMEKQFNAILLRFILRRLSQTRGL